MDERYNGSSKKRNPSQPNMYRRRGGSTGNWDQNPPFEGMNYDNSIYPSENHRRPNVNDSNSQSFGRRSPYSNPNRDTNWKNGNNQQGGQSQYSYGSNSRGNIWGRSTGPQASWKNLDFDDVPNQNSRKRKKGKIVITKSILSKHIYVVILLLFCILAFQGYIVYSFHTNPQYCSNDFSTSTDFMLEPPPPKDNKSIPKLSTQQENELRKNSLPSTGSKCPLTRSLGGECRFDSECCTNFCHPTKKECVIRRTLGEKCDFGDCHDKLICRGKPSASMISKDTRDRKTKKYPLKRTRKCQSFGKLVDGYECQIHRECKSKRCNPKIGICEAAVDTPTKRRSNKNNNKATTNQKKKNNVKKSTNSKKATNLKNPQKVENKPKITKNNEDVKKKNMDSSEKPKKFKENDVNKQSV